MAWHFFWGVSALPSCVTNLNTLSVYGRAGRKENKPFPELGPHNGGIHHGVLYLGDRAGVGVPAFRVPPRNTDIPCGSHKGFTWNSCAFISVTSTKRILKRKPLRGGTYVFAGRSFLNLFSFLYVGLAFRLTGDCLIDSVQNRVRYTARA